MTESEAASGESTRAWLASFDRATSSWKTSGLSGLEDLPLFSETLPRSGMTRNGTLYLLPPLVRLIYATGFGSSPPTLLRTPNSAVVDAKSNVTKLHGRTPQDPQVGLADQLKGIQAGLLPTPTLPMALLPTPTQDAAVVRPARTASSGLPLTMALMPTPTASDAAGAGSRNTASSKAHPGVSLTDWARGDGGRGRLLPATEASDSKNAADYSDGSRGHSPQLRHLGNGLLNPRFVESMMRLPSGWTELP